MGTAKRPSIEALLSTTGKLRRQIQLERAAHKREIARLQGGIDREHQDRYDRIERQYRHEIEALHRGPPELVAQNEALLVWIGQLIDQQGNLLPAAPAPDAVQTLDMRVMVARIGARLRLDRTNDEHLMALMKAMQDRWDDRPRRIPRMVHGDLYDEPAPLPLPPSAAAQT